MAKYRKDTKGQILHKGETYNKNRKQYRYSYTDVFGKRHSVYALSLDKLREKEKIILKDTIEGLDPTRSNIDVNSVFDRYIATKTELKDTSLVTYSKTYDKFVRNGFGKRKIANIRYSDIVIFYKSILDLGYSMSTVNGVNTLLNPTFQFAVRDEIIKSNPTAGAIAELKKKSGYSPNIKKALSREEQALFFSLLENPKKKNWKNLFTVLFGTGCRISELIGLQWQNIDFENRLIHINHSVTYYARYDNNYKCDFRFSTPKTKAGNRTIPMLDKVYEALLSEKELQEQSGRKCNIIINGYSDFIFFNSRGRLYTIALVTSAIRNLINNYNKKETLAAEKDNRSANLMPMFTPHTARHTFCTRLCENETNPKVIQTVMGHSNIATTLDIYAKVSEAKKQDVFNELNNKNII